MTLRRNSCLLNFASCCINFSSLGCRTRHIARISFQTTVISSKIFKEEIFLINRNFGKCFNKPVVTFLWPLYKDFCLLGYTNVSLRSLFLAEVWQVYLKILLYGPDLRHRQWSLKLGWCLWRCWGKKFIFQKFTF